MAIGYTEVETLGGLKYQKLSVRSCVWHHLNLLIEKEADNSNGSGYISITNFICTRNDWSLDFLYILRIITAIAWQTSDISPIVLRYKTQIN